MGTLWIPFLLLGLAGAAAPEGDSTAPGPGGPPSDEETASRVRAALSLRPEVAEAARRDLGGLDLEAVPALEAHLQDPSARMILVEAIETICDQAITTLAQKGEGELSKADRDRVQAWFRRTGPLAASTIARVLLYGRGDRLDVAKELWSRLLADPREDEGAQARLRSALPLSAPLLAHLAGQEETPGRYTDTLRGAVETEVARLGSDDCARREEAAEILFRIGAPAEPVLREYSESDDPHLALMAGRLLQQVRWRISGPLSRTIPGRLEGFEEMDWRERRAVIGRLERLGGPDAIPTLRKIAEAEESEGVRVFAAESLARMGDPAGIAYLNLLGLRDRYLTPRVTVGIYMDQGLRYLREDDYERAAAEFLKILEIDPEDDLAHYNLACTYSLWGKTEEALDSLEASLKYGFQKFDHIDGDEDLDPIREEARFLEMIEKYKALKAAKAGKTTPR